MSGRGASLLALYAVYLVSLHMFVLSDFFFHLFEEGGVTVLPSTSQVSGDVARDAAWPCLIKLYQATPTHPALDEAFN